MEVRLACVVSTIDELKTKLAQYLAGEKDVEGLHRGEAKRDKEVLSVLAHDDIGHTAIETWLSKGNVDLLANLWVRGMAFNWTRLYGDAVLRRVSLPTYPFAKERYWVRLNNGNRTSSGPVGAHEDVQLRRWESLLVGVENGTLSADTALALAALE
jgi:acyl transferase domain-containing protein